MTKRQHLVEALRQELRAAMTQNSGQSGPWLTVDLTMAQLKALLVLNNQGEARVGEIASQLGLSPNATTALLDQLETAGYSERRPDPADRRAVLVVLTPAGAELIAELLTANLVAFEVILEYLSLDELEDLHRGMTALMRALSEHESSLKLED